MSVFYENNRQTAQIKRSHITKTTKHQLCTKASCASATCRTWHLWQGTSIVEKLVRFLDRCWQYAKSKTESTATRSQRAFFGPYFAFRRSVHDIHVEFFFFSWGLCWDLHVDRNHRNLHRLPRPYFSQECLQMIIRRICIYWKDYSFNSRENETNSNDQNKTVLQQTTVRALFCAILKVHRAHNLFLSPLANCILRAVAICFRFNVD